MAIYVMFKCCKCQYENKNSCVKLHLYSCSRNKTNVYQNVCEHFGVMYSFETHWRFIKWFKIIIEATSFCRICNHKYYFGRKTFNEKDYDYNDYDYCGNCKNVLAYSVHGYRYENDGRGFNLQRRLLQEEKERIRKIQEERKRQQKIKKMKETIEKQIELNNELDKNIDELTQCDTNWIENEYKQINMTTENTFSNNINFNAVEEMNNLINFQIIKI